jgi:site-specific recombinase XerD
MGYRTAKGLDAPKVQKADEEKFLAPAQVVDLLQAVRSHHAPEMIRDDAVIYLGFYLALRVGECAILDRETFRDLGRGNIYVKTLKRATRIKVNCPCGKRYMVSMTRTSYPCPKCGAENPVKVPKGKRAVALPEVKLPFIEPQVVHYLQAYLKRMPRTQRWLFPGADRDSHISESQVQRIFASYLKPAGLSNIYSYHALRHGRGMQLWDHHHDLAILRDFMRHKSLDACQWYVHASPQTKKRIVDELSREAITFRKG